MGYDEIENLTYIDLESRRIQADFSMLKNDEDKVERLFEDVNAAPEKTSEDSTVSYNEEAFEAEQPAEEQTETEVVETAEEPSYGQGIPLRRNRSLYSP